MQYEELEEEEDDGEKEDVEDEEGSDGWGADGEYIPSWASGHVNVEGRRRAQNGHASGRRKGEVVAVVGEWAREREREGRRHSAAV
jgi:hypothetical protein